MESTARPGSLIISLDFELMWGMFDKVTNESYGPNLDGVHTVLPELLHLFAERGIHATWATVGMLMYPTQTELASTLPAAVDEPRYENSKLSAYEHIKTDSITQYPKHYFALDLVEQIIATPNQELASHTFSHYYCKETQTVTPEMSEAFFAADCRAFATTTRRLGQTATSLVFPRNQWTKAALNTLATFGFTAFRGTETHFLYRARTDMEQQNYFVRGLRLMDHYLNLSGHHTYPLNAARIHQSGLVNLPASRFLRPWSKRLSVLEPVRLRRIKNSLTEAAKNGEVFHLWWHPHNFGANQKENLYFLTSILDHFAKLQKQYGMQSYTMREAATHVLESSVPNASVN